MRLLGRKHEQSPEPTGDTSDRLNQAPDEQLRRRLAAEALRARKREWGDNYIAKYGRAGCRIIRSAEASLVQLPEGYLPQPADFDEDYS